VQLEILPDAESLAHRAAELFASGAQEAVAARGAFTVALSGGETPRELYRYLAQPPHSGAIPWRAVYLYWGDERCVPPEDARSNYGMARDALIRHVCLSAANVHRLRGEDEPDEAARAYERELLEPPARPAESEPPVPVLDLILLGLGADGHMASLFPYSPALTEKTRLVVPNEGEGTGPRLTVTLPVINAARSVWFLVCGAGKAAIVAKVLEGAHMSVAMPAQAVAPAPGVLSWLLDEAAAAKLSSGHRAG
jgi:6-phosphogluconolactonase